MKYQSIILEDNKLSTNAIIDLVEGRKNIKINKFLVNIIDTDKHSIGISELVELTSWAYLKNEDSIKLAIIKSAERMTIEAQNSILKLLEEPPENTLILMQTINADSFLDTIISRCERIDMKNEKLINKEIKAKVESLFSSEFLERQEILAEFLESRSELTTFLENILKFALKNNFDSKFLEFMEFALESIQRNVNAKLVLNNLNLEIEDLNYKL